ncbi:MAG: NADH dehydrogenase (quinone) subunit D [Ignavibacteriales bacterium]|nr:MAG: NADH dehydrogenase (quinone) subunit D [Ignavibacteriaceae bacterium]MBW7871929.1 NADH dehydrogenase (quinone) subunit D [Ignavibacteria bacterium]MCZ2144220.1 NADH dehydrogenase (quinone) subunit D [Ignavibacteriales bacterium]OQY79017.1 MAG: NADH-quinone oxidoreductase subunit D [Ignavibacteriales bacterium UTCHB3]MBV6446174.1 NADH-quinone oxidoreductase subunit 4 [Ignavibacteriaceae bacterium]
MERLTKEDVHPKIVKALLAEETNINFEDALDNEMILNIGPQHPATHGVLRVLVRLDGETIVAAVPELGYLHRGYEKMAENMTYFEFLPHTDRLDYISPPANNTALCLAVEKLYNLEVPPRAQWIRMIMCELARMTSHLIAIGTFAMDVGAMTVLLWALREREKILNAYDIICGARFTTSYTRIGGVASDMPDEAVVMLREFLGQFDEKLEEMENLLNTNRIFVERLEGVGVISKEDAISLGLTGPVLRGSGVEHDLRRANPYLYYDQVDFKIPVYTEGDSLARYFVRVDEMRESVKIIYQCLDKVPRGEIMANNPKRVLPRKTEIFTKMEELIMDFMIINFGTEPPVGEIYSAVENPKGELGFYIVSTGAAHPWKMKIRSPSFCNLQSLAPAVKGHMISDIVAIIGSLDPVMGEADK